MTSPSPSPTPDRQDRQLRACVSEVDAPKPLRQPRSLSLSPPRDHDEWDEDGHPTPIPQTTIHQTPRMDDPVRDEHGPTYVQRDDADPTQRRE